MSEFVVATIRRAWIGRITRLGINLVLLAAVVLHCGLALVDHHAAEYDPWHDHIVIAIDGVTRARELASHRHGRQQPHDHSPVADHPTHRGGAAGSDASDSHVIAIPDHVHSSGISLFGVTTEYLFALDQAIALAMPSGVGGSFVAAFLTPTEITLPPPEPPPRAIV